MTQRPEIHTPVPGRTEWTVLWIWLARIVAVAMAVAVLVGVVGGVAVRATTDPTDGWRELAAFAAAAVLAVVGAVLVGVVGAVLLVRRFVPRGRRAPVVGWTVGVLVVVVAVTAASGAVVDLLVLVIAAGVVIVAPVVLIVFRERDRLRSTPAPPARRRSPGAGPPTPGAPTR